MAIQESWETRDSIILLLRRLQDIANYYKSTFAALNEIKVAILDDPVKKANLKTILDLDPNHSMASVTAEYVAAKANNDALVDILTP